MSHDLIAYELAARFQTAKHVVWERLAQRERGASALEYVGMVLVAAVIVGAVYGAVQGDVIKTAVGNAIKTIVTGPSAGGGGGEDGG